MYDETQLNLSALVNEVCLDLYMPNGEWHLNGVTVNRCCYFLHLNYNFVSSKKYIIFRTFYTVHCLYFKQYYVELFLTSLIIAFLYIYL